MKRHDLDLVSLVFGLLFVVIGAGYLVGEATDVHVDAEWVVPAVLVGLGLAGLAGTLAGRRRADGDGNSGGDG